MTTIVSPMPLVLSPISSRVQGHALRKCDYNVDSILKHSRQSVTSSFKATNVLNSTRSLLS